MAVKKSLSPLRYPGGKNKLSSYVQQLIKYNNLEKCTYIEPYTGGGAVALRLLFDGVVDNIIINDFDRSIYAFWYSVLNYTDELCSLIEKTPVTMENWFKQRDIQKEKDNVDLLTLGFSTLFLNRTNRSGIIKAGVIGGLNQTGNYKIDCRFNKDNIIEKIKSIANFKEKITLYNLDTLKIYPFKFSLTLGYVLNKNKIDVIYQVENLDDNVMYFQIGGHPAFKCPINPNTKRSDCYIKFENRSEVVSSKVDPRGYATDEKITFKLDDGFLKIADNLFEFDALVIENQGISGVSICDESKNPYVTVHMNVPIFGVWSINESAPFVCIEPWYGRCDRVGYDGELKDREYVNSLNPQKTFNSCYQIEII